MCVVCVSFSVQFIYKPVRCVCDVYCFLCISYISQLGVCVVCIIFSVFHVLSSKVCVWHV